MNVMRFPILISVLLNLPFSVNCQDALGVFPTDGLVGLWLFDGNSNDASGNENHGVVHGATPTEDRFGIPDRAFSFDGFDDYIEIEAASSIAPESDYTWAFWFNSNSSTYNGTFLGCYTWFCKLGHDFAGLFYKDEQGSVSNTWYIQEHFLVNPVANEWHQLCIRKTSTVV